jgi:hypothetical protein
MDTPVVVQQPRQSQAPQERQGAQAAAPAARGAARPGQAPRPAPATRFERSEARLRDDQVDDLAILARRLDRARKRLSLGGERITGSTLMRVAADFLLSHKAELRGPTEADLLDSLQKPRT